LAIRTAAEVCNAAMYLVRRRGYVLASDERIMLDNKECVKL
jgi:hypothetical protein